MGERSYNFRTGLRDASAAMGALESRLFPLWVRAVVFAVNAATIAAGLAGGYLVASTYTDQSYALLAIAAGWAFGVFFGRPIRDAARQWALRRAAKASTHDDVAASLTIDDAGIVWMVRGAETRVAWYAVDRVFIDRGSLFFVAGLSVYFVPAHCFPGDAARLTAFQDALTRLTPDARKRSAA